MLWENSSLAIFLYESIIDLMNIFQEHKMTRNILLRRMVSSLLS